jgi:hypothetical protein
MPIERMGHMTERQKERTRRAIERVELMIKEVNKTVDRYKLLDIGYARDNNYLDQQALDEFNEASELLLSRLTSPEDRK